MATIDLYFTIGDEEMVTIRGDKESICFDRHHIINNDDGWFDGFELNWEEIFTYCKEGMEREQRAIRIKNLNNASKGENLI